MSKLSGTERFFWTLTSRPLLVVLIALAILLGTSAGLVKLVKDTSVKAFIPSDHPALLADENITEIFGLTDTIAVALMSRDGESVFQPERLAIIAALSEHIAELENVRDDRVASLATKRSISGDGGALLVDDYIFGPGMSNEEAADAAARWQAMPQHQGTLASQDAGAAIIMAELLDVYQAEQTYEAIRALIATQPDGVFDFHIAGPGAVSGLLSAYIDRDASRLQPFVFLLVVSFIYIAFRRLSALPGAVFVVLGATGGAMGLMAWAGIPYYAITNALPVIIIAISVADTLHILSAYYQYRAEDPAASVRELVVRAMATMLRPITLTTLTTVAGFIGIAAASIMPPISAFAWFAALGVILAWLFSIIALPNLLVLIQPGPSPAFANWAHNRPSGTGRFLAHLGAVAARRYQLVLTLFLAFSLVALYGALQVRVDRSQVDNFARNAPIRMADELINERFAGTAFLNLIIETDEVEGLISLARMQRIIDLQNYIEQLPHVQKTVAITDYISQLHRAIEALPPGEERLLPDSDAAIAQYLFLYEISGDPTDLEEEIDTEYMNALLRVVLNEHHFSENRDTVDAIQQYVRTQFNEPGMTATLGGDVTLTYHWMRSLQETHLSGVWVSLALVLLMSIVVFRSVTSGIVSVVPVCFAVLVLYACMGFTGVYLEPATSMFAAIALGVGVDFAIHLVDRLRVSLSLMDEDISAAVDHALPPVARACFFNSVALGLGFAALMLSSLPTLQRFGALITVAAFASYLAALVLVPALFAAGRALNAQAFVSAGPRASRIGLLAIIVIAATILAQTSMAQTALDGETVARLVDERPEAAVARRVIDITLTDRRNRSREREALILRHTTDEARLTRITYLAPNSVQGVAFLSHDHHAESRDDDRWLYMPATRQARRLPSSARGDYFLGTDFTYEDMQSEFRFNLNDYDFDYLGQSEINGVTRHRISGTPKSSSIARELGYGGFEAEIDGSTWIPMHIDFVDPNGRELKTVVVNRVDVVDGYPTPVDFEASNLQSGHHTHFLLRQVSHPDALPAEVFEANALTRGLPASVMD